MKNKSDIYDSVTILLSLFFFTQKIHVDIIKHK